MTSIVNCFDRLALPIRRKLKRALGKGRVKEQRRKEEAAGAVRDETIQEVCQIQESAPSAAFADSNDGPYRPLAPTIQVHTPTLAIVGSHGDDPLPSASAISLASLIPRRNSETRSNRTRSDSNCSTNSVYELRQRLEDARIESPHRPHNFIIPKCVQKELITIGAIERDIRARNPNLAYDEVAENAKKAYECAAKLYAILAYIKKGEEICPLLKEGITDTDLPFVRKRNAKRKFALHRNDGKEISALENWKDKHLENFDRCQWWINAPVFGYQEHWELDSKAILPFIPLKPEEESLGKKQGGYSEVFPVRIHPSHHKFWSSSTPYEDEPLIAVKQLFSPDEVEFQKEETILKALGRKNHPNLISLLGTYRQDEKYHLMFPYADANLRSYWEDKKMPNFDRATLLWSLEQMTGIASGLVFIHNFTVTHPLSVVGAGNKRLPQGKDKVELSVREGEQWFGRHGDIKPENILWFAPKHDSEDANGVLQIADFGLGRFHGRDSRSGVNPDTVLSSPTYEPPECKLRQPVSRAYDIWSLGCLYLEFVTWLLKGSAEIDGFSDRRGRIDTETGIDNDNFFTIIHGVDGVKAVVREQVISWTNELHAHPKCSRMIHDILDLTMNELLVIDSKDRCRASQLHQELQKYLRQARIDEDYLLTPIPRQMRTNSAPAGLSVPYSHGRSHSVTSPRLLQSRQNGGKVRSKAQVQAALPRDLVLRGRGTPNLMTSKNRPTYKTWPHHSSHPIT